MYWSGTVVLRCVWITYQTGDFPLHSVSRKQNFGLQILSSFCVDNRMRSVQCICRRCRLVFDRTLFFKSKNSFVLKRLGCNLTFLCLALWNSVFFVVTMETRSIDL